MLNQLGNLARRSCPTAALIWAGLLASTGCGVPRPSPGLRPVGERPAWGQTEAKLQRGVMGARLGLGLSTLSVGHSDRHPDTFWQPGFAVGLNGERALNGVLSFRPEISASLKGAATESPAGAKDGTEGHVNLWYLSATPLLLARFGAADAKVRPFIGLGPYVAWRIHTSAMVGEARTPAAEAQAPYRDLDLGTALLTGLWIDAGPQYGLFSVDLGLEAGLWNVAEEAYRPYGGDQTLRTLNARLGVTWHFWSPAPLSLIHI